MYALVCTCLRTVRSISVDRLWCFNLPDHGLAPLGVEPPAVEVRMYVLQWLVQVNYLPKFGE